MNNFGYCKYTYLHRKSLEYFIKNNKYLNDEDRNILLEHAKYHDLDKMVLYLFWTKDEASKYHKQHNRHHIDTNIDPNYVPNRWDVLESIFDFECAAATKEDKPLNAYDTILKYFKDMLDLYLPYLKELHMDSSYIIRPTELVKYIGTLNVTEDDILQEVQTYLLNCDNNIYIQLKDRVCSEEEYLKLINFSRKIEPER